VLRYHAWWGHKEAKPTRLRCASVLRNSRVSQQIADVRIESVRSLGILECEDISLESSCITLYHLKTHCGGSLSRSCAKEFVGAVGQLAKAAANERPGLVPGVAVVALSERLRVRYFRTMQSLNIPPRRRGVKRASDGTTADEPAKRGTMRGVSKAGATGLEPAFGRR
jgi:hypothetical protein